MKARCTDTPPSRSPLAPAPATPSSGSPASTCHKARRNPCTTGKVTTVHNMALQGMGDACSVILRAPQLHTMASHWQPAPHKSMAFKSNKLQRESARTWAVLEMEADFQRRSIPFIHLVNGCRDWASGDQEVQTTRSCTKYTLHLLELQRRLRPAGCVAQLQAGRRCRCASSA
jgi:hypothetical protein